MTKSQTDKNIQIGKVKKKRKYLKNGEEVLSKIAEPKSERVSFDNLISHLVGHRASLPHDARKTRLNKRNILPPLKLAISRIEAMGDGGWGSEPQGFIN